MENSWQPQPQQQPQTILIPQPVVIRRGVPFMRRGAKLSSGVRCGTFSLVFLPIIGIVILYIGILLACIIDSIFIVSIILCLVGGLLTFSGCYLCCLASKQFKALPANHPERIKYSSGVAVPVRGRHAYTTYDIPPGSNVVTYPVSVGPSGEQIPLPTQPGQPGSFALQQQPGQFGSYPVPVAGQPGTCVIAATGHPTTYPAPTVPQSGHYPESTQSLSGNYLAPTAGQPGSSVPPSPASLQHSEYNVPTPERTKLMEDSPPAYSDVVKQEYI